MSHFCHTTSPLHITHYSSSSNNMPPFNFHLCRSHPLEHTVQTGTPDQSQVNLVVRQARSLHLGLLLLKQLPMIPVHKSVVQRDGVHRAGCVDCCVICPLSGIQGLHVAAPPVNRQRPVNKAWTLLTGNQMPVNDPPPLLTGLCLLTGTLPC